MYYFNRNTAPYHQDNTHGNISAWSVKYCSLQNIARVSQGSGWSYTTACSHLPAAETHHATICYYCVAGHDGTWVSHCSDTDTPASSTQEWALLQHLAAFEHKKKATFFLFINNNFSKLDNFYVAKPQTKLTENSWSRDLCPSLLADPCPGRLVLAFQCYK